MKLIGLSSATTLAMIALGVVSTTADAAEVATYDASGSISFVSGGTSITPPIDPTDPTNPINPTDPTGITPPTPGPLSIDYASNWNFGENTIAGTTATYYAQPVQTDKGARPLWTQVTDNRGTFAGWGLSLKQDSQFTTTDTNVQATEPGYKISGAELEFVGSGSTQSTSSSPASVVQTGGFKLTPGVTQSILRARVNEGMGVNTYVFGDIADYDTNATGKTPATKGPVQLTVPGGSTRVSGYTTTLTWTLDDIPAP